MVFTAYRVFPAPKPKQDTTVYSIQFHLPAPKPKRIQLFTAYSVFPAPKPKQDTTVYSIQCLSGTETKQDTTVYSIQCLSGTETKTGYNCLQHTVPSSRHRNQRGYNCFQHSVFFPAPKPKRIQLFLAQRTTRDAVFLSSTREL